jgi:hypothetical protein
MHKTDCKVNLSGPLWKLVRISCNPVAHNNCSNTESWQTPWKYECLKTCRYVTTSRISSNKFNHSFSHWNMISDCCEQTLCLIASCSTSTVPLRDRKSYKYQGKRRTRTSIKTWHNTSIQTCSLTLNFVTRQVQIVNDITQQSYSFKHVEEMSSCRWYYKTITECCTDEINITKKNWKPSILPIRVSFNRNQWDDLPVRFIGPKETWKIKATWI